MALEGDIKVPLLGDVPKKTAVLVTIGAAGLGIVVYLRARSAAQSAASAGSTDATATSDTSGIDPATGIPYDQESGNSYYDSGAIDPSTGVPYADESGYGGVGSTDSGYDAAGYPIGSAADLAWQQEQDTGISTNEQWLEQAISGAVPGSPDTIQAALSGVLGGLTVTTAQRNLFLEAVGILGQPPQGYPQPIKTSDTSGQPGTPATQEVTVPNVVGQPQEAAFAILSAAGLHTAGTPVVHGKVLTVESQSPVAGKKVKRGSTVTLTSKVVAGK